MSLSELQGRVGITDWVRQPGEEGIAARLIGVDAQPRCPYRRGCERGARVKSGSKSLRSAAER
jgi:hypothetical protein